MQKATVGPGFIAFMNPSLVFPWYIVSSLFTFNLSVSLYLRNMSCKQNMVVVVFF